MTASVKTPRRGREFTFDQAPCRLDKLDPFRERSKPHLLRHPGPTQIDEEA